MHIISPHPSTGRIGDSIKEALESVATCQYTFSLVYYRKETVTVLNTVPVAGSSKTSFELRRAYLFGARGEYIYWC